MPKIPDQKREDEVLKRLLKMPPQPFTPKRRVKVSPAKGKAKDKPKG